MKNLGIASVEVRYSTTLPNIDPSPVKIDWDVSAHNWDQIKTCPKLSPIFCEYIESPDGAFSAIFPAKRKYYVNNYIMGASSSGSSPSTSSTGGDSGSPPVVPSTVPSIVWTPVNNAEAGSQADLKAKGVLPAAASLPSSSLDPPPPPELAPPYPPEAIMSQKTFVPAADFKMPGEYGSVANYQGAKWLDSVIPAEAQPNDTDGLGPWVDYVRRLGATVSGLGTFEPVTPETTTDTTTNPSTWHYVNQSQTRSGLIWGIESSNFLKENMPFWVHIKRTITPPDVTMESFIVISLGPGNGEDWYELYISNNKKPTLYDYRAYGTLKAEQFDFHEDLARVLGDMRDLEIGFMTVAGKLVVWVNKVPLVFTRIEKRSTFRERISRVREAKIAPGKIKIYGSNVQANINVSPMTFAQLGIFGFLIPSYTDAGGVASVAYQGVSTNGTIGGSVAKLPTQPVDSPVTGQLYGVDCKTFDDPVGTVSPIGFGFHKNGKMWLRDGGTIGANGLPKINGFIIVMQPDDLLNFGGTVVPPTGFGPTLPTGGHTIPYAGCPYFFRLKGAYAVDPVSTQSFTNLQDIISVNETCSAPDYFHVKRNATIVLYNKGGRYDFFKDRQYGIQLRWKWSNEQFTTTFTGLTLNASSNEVPGKETLTIQCEDYMYILNSMPIINSPFYDGMIFYMALCDMARRAGIKRIINDWEDPFGEFFLPSGYAFTKPSCRYPSNNTLFDCMMDVVKRCEAFIFFDGNGDFHIKHLPGGLLADTSTGVVVAEFWRNPSNPDATKVILDEKTFEVSLDSTFDRISAMSVDRDSRNPIIYAVTSAVPLILFKKVFLLDQPALGDGESLIDYVQRLGNRIFRRVKKTAFKTVGGGTGVMPLDFVTVDGDEYRVMSLNRTYSADDNSLINEYNCEFLGS
jgi:hypothetical protein